MVELTPEIRNRIRKTVLDIAKRRQKPGTGSGTQRPTGIYQMQWPDLSSVLGGMRWAIVGGVATRRYMRERATDDLDVAVAQEDESDAEARFLDAGFTSLGGLSIPGSQWRSPQGVEIDLILLNFAWTEAALDGAQTNLGTDGMPVLTLPYLTLMKFEAGRPIDIADIARMLAAATEDARAEVRRTFERWSPALLDDLDSTIALGRLESGESA